MNAKILVSACLAGYNCKYNGGNNLVPVIAELVSKGLALPVCPEEWGGLPTPRPASEIKGGDGKDVLNGGAVVVDINGKDVTRNFLEGARKAVNKALEHSIAMAILKERSPSCGVHWIYDGTFKNIKVPGRGVLAEMLFQEGIKLSSEEDLKKDCSILKEFVP